MKKLIVPMIAVAFLVINVFAQENIEEQLFGDVDRILEMARQQKADVYSPQNFTEAMEYYNNAQNSLAAGGNIQSIRENITKAESHLEAALDFADLAKLSFGAAIESREDAQTAAADMHANELWKEAEEKYKEAMEEMEDDDLEDAKERAGEAETAYRKAELAAIKVNLIGPAVELIKKAEEIEAEEYAPVSLEKARNSLKNVENLIDKNRYAKEEGLSLAQEAKYSAKHTVFLTQKIRSLKEKDTILEEVLLSFEKDMRKIGGELDINLDFSEGYDKPIDLMVTEIQSLRDMINKYSQELSTLRDQNSLMENRLAKYTDTEKDLQNLLAIKKAQETIVKTITKNFSRAEGQVFLNGDNVIIRLYGLTFPSGKSEIKPEYFGLLKKVQDSIREFENCEVVIEGHTDSRGGGELNQKLSDERATSVRTYLVSNMNFPEGKIQALGFGETKPVANNETEVGRAKNRRIDVVIIPEWAEK